MAIQGALNAALAKIVGLLQTTFLVHVVGTALAGILLFVPQISKGNLAALGKAPWYLWLGGLLSVPIVYGVATSIKAVGAAPATTLIVVAQVLTACIVDHFGLFGLKVTQFFWWKWIGICFLALGSWLLLKGR